jgi:hypothetical protein
MVPRQVNRGFEERLERAGLLWAVYHGFARTEEARVKNGTINI